MRVSQVLATDHAFYKPTLVYGVVVGALPAGRSHALQHHLGSRDGSHMPKRDTGRGLANRDRAGAAAGIGGAVDQPYDMGTGRGSRRGHLFSRSRVMA